MGQDFPVICSDFSRSAFDTVMHRANLYSNDHLSAPSDFQGFKMAWSLFPAILKGTLYESAMSVLPSGAIRNKIDTMRHDFILATADKYAEVLVADLGFARSAAILPSGLRDDTAAELAEEHGLKSLTALIRYSLGPVIR